MILGRALQALGLALLLGSVGTALAISGAASAFAAPLARLGRSIVAALPAPAPATVAIATGEPATPPPANAQAGIEFYQAVQNKQFAQAVGYGRAYLAANPGADAFAIDLAHVYVTLGRANDARDLLESRASYLRAHPQAASIWLDLAYRESAAKRYVRAVDDVDQYLQYRPDDASARKQRSYDVAALTPPSPPPPDESALFYAAVQAKDYPLALPYGTNYLAAHPTDNVFAIDLAFAEIAAKNPDAAAAIAQGRMPYIRSNPKAAGLLAALFYAYGDQKSYDAAVEYGELYLAIAPQDDAFALDLAYAEMNLGHIAAARAIVIPRAAYLHAHPASADIWMDLAYKAAGEKHYHEAIADVDTYLTFRPNDASAKTQRTAFVDDIWGGPRYQNYGYAQYEGRFDDTFFGFDQTYALAPAAPVQPYAALYLTEDTRSGAPGSPQIYSDNALIADLGLRSKIGPYVTAFAEGGAGIGLRGQGTITDLRFGLRYFEQWGRRPKPYTTVAASAGFYSRYAGNYISYYQVLHDFGGKTIRPVAGINGGLDSHNIFGNNFLEAFAGAQTGNDNLTFRLVQVQGTYLLRGLNPAPKAGYSTLRGTVFFSIK